jgi:hypothetical protein
MLVAVAEKYFPKADFPPLQRQGRDPNIDQGLTSKTVPLPSSPPPLEVP